MVFYISLFVVCVIGAFGVVYLYNAIASVGKAFYRGLLPSSKNEVTGHRSRTRYYSTRNDTPSPWGWKGNGNKFREQRPKAATVNGNSGLNAFIHGQGKQSALIGRPYLQEKTEFAGTAYKVSRKTVSTSTNRESIDKPWGW